MPHHSPQGVKRRRLRHVLSIILASSVAGSVLLLAPTFSSAVPSSAPDVTEVVSAEGDLVLAPQRPVQFSTLAEAKSGLSAPKDANYVLWPENATYLHEALRNLGANDILVLPERDQPYLIDTRDGFRAAGIVAVDGPNNERIPINSRYSDNGKTANMWFAMARATRGIIGMGPKVKIELADSSWRQGAQKSPPEGVVNPTAEQQRRAWRADGSFQVLSGAQESLIETDTADAFFGNFTMTGRDLGGVAYTAVKLNKGGTVKQAHFIGAGRGFSGVPNGEAGAISFGRNTYLVQNVEIDGRDQTTGEKVGSSPIMWNRVTGGRLDNVSAHHHKFGMPALWNSTGSHQWSDFSTYAGNRVGVNLEKNYGGLTIQWWGGKVEAAPGNGYHLILNSNDGSSMKVTVKNVHVVAGRAGDGVLTSHGYNYGGEVRGQRASDVVLIQGDITTVGTKQESGLNRAYGTIQ